MSSEPSVGETLVADPLDDPIWSSLTGAHAHLAVWRGRVATYPSEVAEFVAVPPGPTEEDWADLAAVVGEGASVPVLGRIPPADWVAAASVDGVQLVGQAVGGAWHDGVVRLTDVDVPEMLALVERTRPGPFRPRTIELGTYLGIRRHGRLVAMAGERLRPAGYTEISAVCTDPDWRGQGFATALVLSVAAGIRRRGETPMMHAAASNTNAIRLYESLGFHLRRTLTFDLYRVPAGDPPQVSSRGPG